MQLFKINFFINFYLFKSRIFKQKNRISSVSLNFHNPLISSFIFEPPFSRGVHKSACVPRMWTHVARMQHACGRMHFQPGFLLWSTDIFWHACSTHATRMWTHACTCVCMRATHAARMSLSWHPSASGGTGCDGSMRANADSEAL